MATIGTFTAADNGYTGSVKTLTLNVKAKFVATEKENDKAPDYRIFADSIEFGAAWKKTARDSDREYLSVKLDDPSFPAPIYASLVKGAGDNGFTLIWSPAATATDPRGLTSPASSEAGSFGFARARAKVNSAPRQKLHDDMNTRRVKTRACRAPFGRVIPLSASLRFNDDHDDPAQNEQPVSSGFRVNVSRVERPRGSSRADEFADSSPASFIAGIKAARERIVARSDEDRDSYLRKRGFSKSETAKLVETVLHDEGRPPGGARQGASGRASRALGQGEAITGARLKSEEPRNRKASCAAGAFRAPWLAGPAALLAKTTGPKKEMIGSAPLTYQY